MKNKDKQDQQLTFDFDKLVEVSTNHLKETETAQVIKLFCSNRAVPNSISEPSVVLNRLLREAKRLTW